jgi:ABC-type polysaccharide/polyol phosphate export permease
VALNTQQWVENRPSRGFRGVDARELWAYRELALSLALRDLKVRYKQAIFGVLWAVLQPLAGAAVFTFVFARMAKVSSGPIPYVLFAFVGTAAWSYHSSAVTGGTESLVENSSLVTKIYFPKLVSPLASSLTPLVDLAISLVLLAVLLPIYGVNPGWPLLTLPLGIVLLMVVAFSFSLWFGALNVRYRDVRYVVRFGVQLWLFISPVAYPLQLVSQPWRSIYQLNPMVGVLGLLRWSLVGGPPPGAALLSSVVVTLVVLLAGLTYFQRTERRFADVI